jgi:predicted nucleic acid-binding protein
MILVDTSVWIDHLRQGDPDLVRALEAGEVLAHPFVVGELACGNLKNRTDFLRLLRTLPQAPVATDAEALAFIDGRALMGRGIGYLDVHLLAAVALAGTATLWTRDKRLAAVAQELGLSYAES